VTAKPDKRAVAVLAHPKKVFSRVRAAVAARAVVPRVAAEPVVEQPAVVVQQAVPCRAAVLQVAPVE
jgi:hypothetical protein